MSMKDETMTGSYWGNLSVENSMDEVFMDAQREFHETIVEVNRLRGSQPAVELPSPDSGGDEVNGELDETNNELSVEDATKGGEQVPAAVRKLNVSTSSEFDSVQEAISTFFTGDVYDSWDITQVPETMMTMCEYWRQLSESDDITEADHLRKKINEVIVASGEWSGYLRKFWIDGQEMKVPTFSFLDSIRIPHSTKYKEALNNFRHLDAACRGIERFLTFEDQLLAIKSKANRLQGFQNSLLDPEQTSRHYNRWRFWNNPKTCRTKCPEFRFKEMKDVRHNIKWSDVLKRRYLNLMDNRIEEYREAYREALKVQRTLAVKLGFKIERTEEEETIEQSAKDKLSKLKKARSMARGICAAIFTGTTGVYDNSKTKEVTIGDQVVYENTIKKGFTGSHPLLKLQGNPYLRVTHYEEQWAKVNKKVNKGEMHPSRLEMWENEGFSLVNAHRDVMNYIFGPFNFSHLARVTDAAYAAQEFGGNPEVVKAYKSLLKMMLKTHLWSCELSDLSEKYQALKLKADVKRSIKTELWTVLRKRESWKPFWAGLYSETDIYGRDNSEADTADPYTRNEQEADVDNYNFNLREKEIKAEEGRDFIPGVYKSMESYCKFHEINCPFTSANHLFQVMTLEIGQKYGNYKHTPDMNEPAQQYDVQFLDFKLVSKLFIKGVWDELKATAEEKSPLPSKEVSKQELSVLSDDFFSSGEVNLSDDEEEDFSNEFAFLEEDNEDLIQNQLDAIQSVFIQM